MLKRIKILREKNNLSLEEISTYLEISKQKYIEFETGKKQVPIFILSKLAKKYNTSIDYIIEDTNAITPHQKNS